MSDIDNKNDENSKSHSETNQESSPVHHQVETSSDESVIMVLLPYLAATVVITLLVIVALFKYTPFMGVKRVDVVTFDTLKYVNSQRAVFSKYIAGKDNAAPELINGLSTRAKASIQKIAGPGTLVVLRQAVVQGDGYDITDEVLKDLGLPTDVPTNVKVDVLMSSSMTSFDKAVPPITYKKVPGEDRVQDSQLP